MLQFLKVVLVQVFLISYFTSNSDCQKLTNSGMETDVKSEKPKKEKVKLPQIDLSHWKVTLPVADEKGNPYEIDPPEILNFASNEIAKPFMYVDSTDGSIVFYAYPTSTTTTNTKYSRSELREQMVAGENNKNWTFKDGGSMKGKLSMESISKDNSGKYHKTIIMQIHGRLTNAQRDLIGATDNNAPPILKIYWQNGQIRVKSKVLKSANLKGDALLHEEAWDDDEGFTFKQEVGFRKFTLEVKVSEGKMVVILNNNEFKVIENNSLEEWGIFENYFKAGNYFQSRDEGSFAKVKFYELSVKH